jgi:hypothetical protein
MEGEREREREITRKTKIGGSKSGNGTQLSGRGRPSRWTYRQ